VNGIRPANCQRKVRVLRKKGLASQGRHKKCLNLRTLLRAELRRLIFRRIPEIGLSKDFAKADVRKHEVRSNQFIGWISSRAQSFAHAGRGLLLLYRTQWNFRIHLVAGVGAISLAFYFQISALEWLPLISAIALVLCAEALNTALERTVDLLEPERHPLARDAKDLAAAGVLMASLLSLIVGLIIFGPRLFGLLSK
jgi:diacylglycerol kinase